MIKVSNADQAGSIRYEQMTPEEYQAGIDNATANALAVDYGDRTGATRNRWGRYITLYAENRSAADVISFQAAIGWTDPA